MRDTVANGTAHEWGLWDLGSYTMHANRKIIDFQGLPYMSAHTSAVALVTANSIDRLRVDVCPDRGAFTLRLWGI